MRALLCAALVVLWAQCPHGFFFPSPGSFREASQNYHEIMTNCEREGGECVDVDFGTTDPPTPAPTPAPTRATTRAPLPPMPVTYPPFFHFFPFWPYADPFLTYNVQPTAAPAPPPPVPVAPPSPTPAPPATTPAATQAPAGKKARKVGGRKGQGNQNNEQEREVRKRRQLGPWDQLYSECSGGWEFDLGCGVRKGNVCCYSANSGSSAK